MEFKNIHFVRICLQFLYTESQRIIASSELQYPLLNNLAKYSIDYTRSYSKGVIGKVILENYKSIRATLYRIMTRRL